jgi:hypothetical protein
VNLIMKNGFPQDKNELLQKLKHNNLKLLRPNNQNLPMHKAPMNLLKLPLNFYNKNDQQQNTLINMHNQNQNLNQHNFQEILKNPKIKSIKKLKEKEQVRKEPNITQHNKTIQKTLSPNHSRNHKTDMSSMMDITQNTATHSHIMQPENIITKSLYRKNLRENSVKINPELLGLEDPIRVHSLEKRQSKSQKKEGIKLIDKIISNLNKLKTIMDDESDEEEILGISKKYYFI